MTYQPNARNGQRLAIFYEHPHWFKPLFFELDRRGVSYDRQLASEHRFNPSVRLCPYALVVNRMSPSAYIRGNHRAIFYTLEYLLYLKEIGANVVNGYDAYVYEFSKVRQLGLLERLGLRYPRARVINHPMQAPAAAEGLTFPIIIKPNIGGSGAKIVRIETPGELRVVAEAGAIDLGIDHTALVQEYLPAEGNRITRVEFLNGEILYAIQLQLTLGEFNLCPADYCQPPHPGRGLNHDGQTDGVSGRGALVEGSTPPDVVVRDVKRIMAAADIQVGGVEYLVNARDGQVYYYDINAMSNFVANAEQLIGLDPLPRFVDYLLLRAGLDQRVLADSASRPIHDGC